MRDRPNEPVFFQDGDDEEEGTTEWKSPYEQP